MAKHKICADCATIQNIDGAKKCMSCGSKTLIPVDSPKGKELAAGQELPKLKYWTGKRIFVGCVIAFFVYAFFIPTSQTPPAPPRYKTASDSPIPFNENRWRYSSSEDPMSSKKSYFARIDSSNTLNFSFPYSGGQNATLMLRTHPQHGKDVIVQIERGQFLCTSYSGCSVLVRFDDKKAVRYRANGPSDNSSTTLFLSNYSGFVSNLMKAKRVRIQAEVYKEGNQFMEFNVEGFDADQYLEKK